MRYSGCSYMRNAKDVEKVYAKYTLSYREVVLKAKYDPLPLIRVLTNNYKLSILNLKGYTGYFIYVIENILNSNSRMGTDHIYTYILHD